MFTINRKKRTPHSWLVRFRYFSADELHVFHAMFLLIGKEMIACSIIVDATSQQDIDTDLRSRGRIHNQHARRSCRHLHHCLDCSGDGILHEALCQRNLCTYNDNFCSRFASTHFSFRILTSQ